LAICAARHFEIWSFAIKMIREAAFVAWLTHLFCQLSPMEGNHAPVYSDRFGHVRSCGPSVRRCATETQHYTRSCVDKDSGRVGQVPLRIDGRTSFKR